MLIVFLLFYQTVFFGSALLIGLLLNVFLPIEDILSFPVVKVLCLVAFLIFLVVSEVRAKIAAKMYGEGGETLWEAHQNSGEALRVELSFMPVVGRFFVKDLDNS